MIKTSLIKEIPIKNKEILATLNELKWFYDHREELQDIKAFGWGERDKRDFYLTDSMMQNIIDMGDTHDGFPETLYGYNIKKSDYHKSKAWNTRQLPAGWLEKWQKVNDDLMMLLSVRRNAIATLYPPGGYISWHNNANCPGFNLIFSWSEDGDGWFDYLEDNGKGKKVRCQDKKGQWVCRYGMFGSYHQDKHPIVYHAASSEDSWRMTVAYVLNYKPDDYMKAGNEDLHDFIIEEIQTP